jgi:16S rRNA (guanine527-N7)-methyltransferase
MSDGLEGKGSCATAAQALGWTCPTSRSRQLLAYLDLIAKWNKVYNLTAVRDEEMLVQHLLDSLAAVGAAAAAAWRQDRRGAAGRRFRRRTAGRGVRHLLPGAAGRLRGHVGKKAAFIQQAAVQLQLPNLRGVHDRVENLAGPYDVISSRAFASLPDFVNWSGALAEQGVWLAMKGKHPDPRSPRCPRS